MSIRKPLIGFSLFAIFSLFVTFVVWSTLQRTVSGDTNTYSATFTDVFGLHPGDDVRMAGVRVGRVEDIKLDKDNNAVVEMKVERDQQLFTNSRALIRYQNLIGQRYVALDEGTKGDATPLADDGALPLKYPDGTFQTEPSFDVSALLGGFEPLFSALQPDQINSLSNTLILALQGDGVSLSTFITQAADVAQQFQARDQILGDIITNLSGVVNGLASRGGQLDTLVAQTKTLVSGLYDQGQVLRESTETVAGATSALVDMVTQVKGQLQQTQVSTLDAFNLLVANGAKLDVAGDELTKTLTDVARWSQNGGYGNAYACDLDISLWGVLFPRGVLPTIFNFLIGDHHSEVCR